MSECVGGRASEKTSNINLSFIKIIGSKDPIELLLAIIEEYTVAAGLQYRYQILQEAMSHRIFFFFL